MLVVLYQALNIATVYIIYLMYIDIDISQPDVGSCSGLHAEGHVWVSVWTGMWGPTAWGPRLDMQDNSYLDETLQNIRIQG